MQTPYIPSKDADFANWLANFAALITLAPAAYGLAAGDATIIQAAADSFAAAYLLATSPATRTAPTIADKTTERASAEATVRPYATAISRDTGVTDLNKTAVGVNLVTTTRTPVPAPSTPPALTLISATHGNQRLGYRDATTPTSKAKPFGAIGIELYRSVGIVSAVDPAQATYLGTVTKSPTDVPQAAGDVGKLATYFARFVTRSGPAGVAQSGPWSAPLVVTVV